jgi:hypothetical protein
MCSVYGDMLQTVSKTKKSKENRMPYIRLVRRSKHVPQVF